MHPLIPIDTLSVYLSKSGFPKFRQWFKSKDILEPIHSELENLTYLIETSTWLEDKLRKESLNKIKSIIIKHIEKIVKLEKINTGAEVINEIIKLSDGDMRKSLNILQSLHMTCEYQPKEYSSKVWNCKEVDNDFSTSFIDLDSLYKNIGYPLPKEKKLITETIIKSDIITAFNYVKKLEEQKSLSLNDILNELVSYIITNKVYTPIKTARIISKLSEIEYYLAGNINTSIQLGAIISILKSV